MSTDASLTAAWETRERSRRNNDGVRLVSWNVAGRTDGAVAPRLSAQATAIASQLPDLVALQEVTRETQWPWHQRLSEMGLGCVVDTVERLPDDPRRRYANLLASRWPLRLEPGRLHTAFSEKLLSASIEAHGGGLVEIHVFHAPTGVGSAWGKVDALETLHARLAETLDRPRIVCGDFNSPQAEPQGRPLVTFAQYARTSRLLKRAPRWFVSQNPTDPWNAERWDQAERQVLDPRHLGLIDVFRLLHPNAQEATWVWRGAGREVHRRYDHVFATEDLRPRSMHYRHDWREQDASRRRLSDHSGVVVDFGSAASRS